MGRRVEQRQKGGKRKTNRRAFHDPSTITPAAKGPGRKAGPATLSKLAFPAGSCRPPPLPPGGGTLPLQLKEEGAAGTLASAGKTH